MKNIWQRVAAAVAFTGVISASVVDAQADYKSDFVYTYASSAQTLAKQMNLYPSVMIAQMALESNYGTSGLTQSANNLFGVKGTYNGNSIALKTQEQRGHKLVTVKDHFRSYPSKWASMVDYTNIMQGRHLSGAWVSNTSNYRQATRALQGVYATDRNYSAKLNAIIAQYGLTRYDAKRATTTKTNYTVKSTSSGRTQGRTHTVRAGETLSSIAMKYGVPERTIMAKNSLSNANHLVVGKRLVIR